MAPRPHTARRSNWAISVKSGSTSASLRSVAAPDMARPRRSVTAGQSRSTLRTGAPKPTWPPLTVTAAEKGKVLPESVRSGFFCPGKADAQRARILTAPGTPCTCCRHDSSWQGSGEGCAEAHSCAPHLPPLAGSQGVRTAPPPGRLRASPATRANWSGAGRRLR